MFVKDWLSHDSEFIACSAIWYKDLPLIKPEVLENRGFRPCNVDAGIVISGWRHINCMYQVVAITGLRQSESGNSIQGFLTNKNRFVDRYEGAAIALESKQVRNLKYGDQLYSEDIF